LKQLHGIGTSLTWFGCSYFVLFIGGAALVTSTVNRKRAK